MTSHATEDACRSFGAAHAEMEESKVHVQARDTAAAFILALVVSAAVFPARASAADSADSVWSELQTKGSRALADGAELIEGIPLVKTAAGVSAQAAILGSLLRYELGPVGCRNDAVFRAAPPTSGDEYFSLAVSLARGDLLTGVRARRGVSLSSAEKEKVSHVLAAHFAAAREAVENVKRTVETRGAEYRTQGVRDALLLEQYLEAAGPLDALRHFAGERMLAFDAREEASAQLATIIEAIGKGIPPILSRNGQHVLCVGYVTSAHGALLLVYRPDAGRYREVTGKDLVHQVDLDSTVPWIRKAVEQRMRETMYTDFELRLAESLPPGLTVIPFEANGHAALYVYGWRSEIAGLAAELVTELDGQEKE